MKDYRDPTYSEAHRRWVLERYAIESKHWPEIFRLSHISNTDRGPFYEAQRRMNAELRAHDLKELKAPEHVEPVPSDE